MLPSLKPAVYGMPSWKQDFDRRATSKNWASCWASARATSIVRICNPITVTTSEKADQNESDNKQDKVYGHSNTPGKPKRQTDKLFTKEEDICRVRFLSGVYTNDTYSKQRQDHLLNKLETIQLKELEKERERAAAGSVAHHEAVQKQRKELIKINSRFKKQQKERFKRQYVAWKGVEAYTFDTGNYGFGLPVNLDKNDKKQNQSNKQLSTKLNDKVTVCREKTGQLYKHILNPKVGTSLATKVLLPGKMSVRQVLNESEKTIRKKKAPKKGKGRRKTYVVNSAKRLITDNLDTLTLRENTTVEVGRPKEEESVTDNAMINDSSSA